MIKIDKKLSENIAELSKLMDKNNLSEINISDGKNSYKLKKNLTSSESLIKSIFVYTGKKKKLINYYELCKNDLLVAEKTRKAQIFKNIIKFFHQTQNE